MIGLFRSFIWIKNVEKPGINIRTTADIVVGSQFKPVLPLTYSPIGMSSRVLSAGGGMVSRIKSQLHWTFGGPASVPWTAVIDNFVLPGLRPILGLSSRETRDTGENEDLGRTEEARLHLYAISTARSRLYRFSTN
jgi:hypothetical protein